MPPSTFKCPHTKDTLNDILFNKVDGEEDHRLISQARVRKSPFRSFIFCWFGPQKEHLLMQRWTGEIKTKRTVSTPNNIFHIIPPEFA